MIATALVLLALAPAPARLQVGAEEFGYTLSRRSIKAGPQIVLVLAEVRQLHDRRACLDRPARESLYLRSGGSSSVITLSR